jgi:molybdenum cofactor cytidylyltransferase/nicotine blue oxidoreductase
MISTSERSSQASDIRGCGPEPARADPAAARPAGLVLAAGGGRRMGGPKALLRHAGRPLVEGALRTVREAGCDPVVVVLGAAADRVRAAADLTGATVVVNRAWATGLGSSLRAGLAEVARTGAEAALVVPVDMPGITVRAVHRVASLPHPYALVCATFAGRRSYPMLLGRAHWSGIAALANADVGVRPYLLARSAQVTGIGCDRVADPADLDTPGEAARWGIELADG